MKNLDACSAYAKLLKAQSLNRSLQELALEKNENDFTVISPGLTFSYLLNHIDLETRHRLQELADEQHVIDTFQDILSENKISHHALRNPKKNQKFDTEKLEQFITKVHKEKKFSTIVYVGIGGSYLGPEVLYLALKQCASIQIPIHFLHSIDPVALLDILTQIQLQTTLFIFSSKSGSTFETVENFKQLQHRATQAGIKHFNEQCVGITCQNTYLDDDAVCTTRFYINASIVGRFSVTSPIGMIVAGLVFGWPVVKDIWTGAHSMDLISQNPSMLENPALANALISIWNRNIKNYPNRAIIPYAYGLSRFPAYLQQLICESNGKRVNKHGIEISYSTSPAIFGEPGTEAQHSFFQMLHQGTDITPVQFIGIGKATSRNLFIYMKAQMLALAFGNHDTNLFEYCPGNRPSTYVEIDGLSPTTLGKLISFYENSVMFEGFLWNINSFDQEGVQLGKKLAEQLFVET